MAATKSKNAENDAPSGLSNDQLSEVLALVKQSKTVELKVTVPEGSYRATVLALGIDALQAQLRQVVFFDTPDLALNRSGVGRVEDALGRPQAAVVTRLAWLGDWARRGGTRQPADTAGAEVPATDRPRELRPPRSTAQMPLPSVVDASHPS